MPNRTWQALHHINAMLDGCMEIVGRETEQLDPYDLPCEVTDWWQELVDVINRGLDATAPYLPLPEPPPE